MVGREYNSLYQMMETFPTEEAVFYILKGCAGLMALSVRCASPRSSLIASRRSSSTSVQTAAKNFLFARAQSSRKVGSRFASGLPPLG